MWLNFRGARLFNYVYSGVHSTQIREQMSGPDIYVPTVAFLALKKPGFSEKKILPKIFFFNLFSMQLFSADATMFSMFSIFFFFAYKKLTKSPQKVAYLVHLGVFKSLQP